MAKYKVHIGVIIGYVVMAVLTLGNTGISLSVLAKPYTSAHDTAKAIISAVTDTTKTMIISDKAKFWWCSSGEGAFSMGGDYSVVYE